MSFVKIMKGISTDRICSDIASCLKQNGIDFVARYYSRTTKNSNKRLSLEEATALNQADIALIAVYEDNPTSKDYFSSDRGKSDGKSAYAYAQDINQPSQSAIYFAVDYDATSQDIQGPIKEYFQGVFDGLKNSSDSKPIYKIGVYGSGACCDYLRKNLNFVEFSWLAESTGWLNSKTYNTWNIKQSIATTSLCGLDKTAWDSNEAQGNYGQFTIIEANNPSSTTAIAATNTPTTASTTQTGLATINSSTINKTTDFLKASTGTIKRLVLTQVGVVTTIAASVGAFIKAEPTISGIIIITAILGLTWLISLYIYTEYLLDCKRIDAASDPTKNNVT